MFAASAIGGHPGAGLLSFAFLGLTGAVILFGGRSETLRGHRRLPGRDSPRPHRRPVHLARSDRRGLLHRRRHHHARPRVTGPYLAATRITRHGTRGRQTVTGYPPGGGLSRHARRRQTGVTSYPLGRVARLRPASSQTSTKCAETRDGPRRWLGSGLASRRGRERRYGVTRAQCHCGETEPTTHGTPYPAVTPHDTS